jgi:D-inositol-3-phosphate glycosyltransferase
MVKERPRLLVIGDAVAHTGFATLIHSLCNQWYRDWDIAVLGVNYLGDPHGYPYDIFPASLGGDVYGLGRLPNLLEVLKPDLVFIVNDPWIAMDYMKVLREKDIPVVIYTPVDSPNIKVDFAQALNPARLVIGYTQFAVDELKKAGLETQTAVLPHGVDITNFRPLTKKEAREKTGIDPDWFVVGCINRNQARKRIDLLIYYFAEWWNKNNQNPNLRLYWHGALQDLGWDVLQLARYFGVEKQMIITSPKITPGQGVPREILNYIYNSFDIHVSTTLGEGWGFTQAEAAACRIPQIVPRWSALAEWMDGAAHFVDCTSISVNTGGINTIGGVADKDQFVEALDLLYKDPKYRQQLAQKGYSLVSKPTFRWETIAKQFDKAFREILNER